MSTGNQELGKGKRGRKMNKEVGEVSTRIKVLYSDEELEDLNRREESLLLVLGLRLFLPLYPILHVVSVPGIWLIPAYRRRRILSKAWSNFGLMWKAYYSRGAAKRLQAWLERRDRSVGRTWYQAKEEVQKEGVDWIEG